MPRTKNLQKIFTKDFQKILWPSHADTAHE